MSVPILFKHNPAHTLGRVFKVPAGYVVVLHCPAHPGYRAIMRPRAKCERCELIWRVARGTNQGSLS